MGILDGIRVIDCTHAQVGPYAGQMLGDLGADVIHVEGPEHPDVTRGHLSVHGLNIMLPHGRGSVFFEDHNRNKRAITLDLNKAEAREVLHDLVRGSDVFLTNFRASAIRKMGLDYPSLRQVNPRLIYASASGLGRRGPDAQLGVVDTVVDARSAMMMVAGEVGQGPCPLPIGIGDRSAAIFLAYGILGALFHRERTGEGQELHVSQLISMMVLMGNTISSYLWLGQPFPRFNHEHAHNPLHNYYRCADDRWIVMGHYQADRYWPTFCRVTGLAHLEHDPRFESLQRRAENHDALLTIIRDLFLSKTSAEWVESFGKADLLFAIAQSVPELVEDPQVKANDYVLDWEHPITGPGKMMGFPVEFSATPCRIRSAPPAVGEHTEEVLQECCGYDWDRLIDLKERGVI